MDRGPPIKEVWRPKFARDRSRAKNSDNAIDEIPGFNENRQRRFSHKRTPSEESRDGRYQPNKRGSGRRNFSDGRDPLQGTSGVDSSIVRFGNFGMTRPQSVENVNQPPNSTRNIIERWVTDQNPDQGWKMAPNKRGGRQGINRNNTGEQVPDPSFTKRDNRFDGATIDMDQTYSRAAASNNVGRNDRGGGGFSRGGMSRGGFSRGGRGGGDRRGNIRSTMITQLNSLDDWTALSTFDNPLRIMLKLQEFESSWIASFHSNASFEVMDIAFDLLCRIDAKYKYGRLALMKSLFTAPFLERLTQVLVKLKGTWFSSGKDKIVAFVERIRHNIEFILSNDPAFHDNASSKAQISSLIEECISLLIHINAKLLDLQGSNDETIEKEILKIEELSDIKYIEMLVLDEPIHPEDFRSTYDVMPNIVHGAYESDDHYVQTHFGLLKEDFQSTLREGVEQYLVDPKQRNFKIWAYEKVVVKRYFSERDSKKVLFRVTFPECTYFSKIQWKYIKRFMFGSLIVLTANKFETYHLAMVEDRNFDDTNNIFIVISFIYSPPNAVEETKFLLVEPKVFYEPYLHSMKVLKHMAKIGLPLKKYIVNADTTPALPAYMNNDTSYRIGTHDIKISNILSWPKAEDLGLNRSQREAFVNALTSEMALIQGPPGTGKTFLAFKIIATLLLNKKNSYKDGPIMIVCYKNHSLDQILEGLLNKGKKIVRIGGMSKVKALKYDCNVRNLPAPPTISALQKEKQDLEMKLSNIMVGIKDVVAIINLVKSRIGIINIELLKQCSVVEIPMDMPFDQWLMEMVSDAPQLPLEDIHQRCSSIFVSSNSLSRVFGEPSLESLFVTNLYDLGKDLFRLNSILMDNKACRTEEEYYQKWNINERFWLDFHRYKYLAHGLKLSVDPSDCPDPKSVDFPGYHHLEVEERWALYNKWEREFIGVLEEKLILFQNQVAEIEDNLLEYKEMVLAQTLKYERPDVIGVTTSGASKHYSALADVGAKVVLVEEAAEVLEAHVIASLSTKCEHLILIGDHQQLKPTTASFKLGNQYRMGISLFERMINNEIKWSCLSTQHRMRQEIAALICPSIYHNLSNSPSVELYPDVIGTKKNVFFFNHSHPEQVGFDSESKFNPKEGEMLLAICFYLIRQGYNPKDITILSTYLEQDRFIKKTIDRMYNSCVREVNSTVVDNYQGEENIIILLSLVRSNDFGDVGFLSTKNRVCVALSRAKHGLFIFGNMPCLSRKEPTIWSDINEVLISQDSINTKFPLKCTKHNNITEVGSPQDVSALRNAGCSNPCETPLPCGHTCRQLCHGEDQQHRSEFSCMEKCTKKCTNGHTCNALCRVDCPPCPILVPKLLVCNHSLQLECHKPNLQSYCTDTVEIKLDACGHNQTVLCKMTMNRERIVCKAICLKEYTCGHICKRTCHISTDPNHIITHLCEESCELINKSCPRKHRCNKKCRQPCGDCLVRVEKTLQCNHKAMMMCSQDVSSFICKERCSRKLPCNHDCVNRCDEKCGPCSVKVEKVIEACGHKLNVRCSDVASRSNCKERCETIRSCGHQCPGLCKNICEEQFCHVTDEVELPCGHKSSVKCGDLEKRRHDISSMCSISCQALLPCGHLCEGTCGSCLQNRIHLPCRRACEKTLVCSHKCRSRCNDAYHTCATRNCLKKCWQNEINNQSFYFNVKSGRGKGKNRRGEFAPEKKLIWDLRSVLGRNCQGIGKYVRDLASSKSISPMVDRIQKFVLRTFHNSYTDGHEELCLLKICLFKVEFMSVFPVLFKRLMNSSMDSSKKRELECFLEKLIFRVSTRDNNIGSYEMQQLQEQMFWVSLAIDAHDIDDIGDGQKDDIVGVLQQALEGTKSSFGPNERSIVFQLLQDFKSAAGVNVPIRTAQWDVMFPTAHWYQPIHHHRPPYSSQDKKDDAPVETEQPSEKSGISPVSDLCDTVDGDEKKLDDSEERSNVHSTINPTGEKEDVSTAKDKTDASSVRETASSVPTAVSGQHSGEGDLFQPPAPQSEDGSTAKDKSDASSVRQTASSSVPLTDVGVPKTASIVPPTAASGQHSGEGDLFQPPEPQTMNRMRNNGADVHEVSFSKPTGKATTQESENKAKALSEFLGLNATPASNDAQRKTSSKVDWGKILEKELNASTEDDEQSVVRRWVQNLNLRGRRSSLEPLIVDSSDSDDDSSGIRVRPTSRRDDIQNLHINDID